MSRQLPAVSTLLTLTVLAFAGCSGSSPESAEDVSADPVVSETEVVSVTEFEKVEPDPSKSQSTADAAPQFKPLSLSGTAPTGDETTVASSGNTDQSVATVIDRLKPLQVMLGQWRGTTRREYEGFKAVDSHEWIWDLQTDEERPALVMSSDKSPYLKKARITWDSAASQFELTATDESGTTRQYAGDYTQPVKEIVGPDDKLHRVFRLEFTQTPQSAGDGETWQIAFAQQENNRYLLEVAKRRGKAAFRRFDTVSTQREGTSFAISDDDYGDKECIISQGLGTIAVSYQGKTYWVCCSGCKAAFDEDPATWIARAAARKKDGA